MPLGNDSAPVLTAHALTPDEFAPFGEVVSTDAAARRSHFRYAFEASERAVQPAMWVSYPSTVSSDEVEITRLSNAIRTPRRPSFRSARGVTWWWSASRRPTAARTCPRCAR